LIVAAAGLCLPAQANPAKRIIIIKIDGLNADLLYGAMHQQDPATGKSLLPWFSHIFGENGTVFENFFTRGISLSAPSWSMLDTGQHSIIRGNVEYDRYTGEVYDYLNFFPFYLGYAHHGAQDMPGVQVLDRAGIPLLIDRFSFSQRFQSLQLYQRLWRWGTLKSALERKFSSTALLSMIENGESPSWESEIQKQMEIDLEQNLAKPQVLYLDFYTGDIDHEGHETSDRGALLATLKRIDSMCGRIWAISEKSPLAKQTVYAVVSDHGMNNVPGVVSETFSLTDLLNSPAGGAHHVVTNRVQLSDYKLAGLNPLVHRSVSPSTASFYLKGEQSIYPTAWLDIDGNERAAIHLRNNDLNTIHILLKQLARPELSADVRRAAAAYLQHILDRHRAQWEQETSSLLTDLGALDSAIAQRKALVSNFDKNKRVDDEEKRTRLRLTVELTNWGTERTQYSGYVAHLRALLNFQPDGQHAFAGKISELVPEMSLGDNNNVSDLENYVVGPGPLGLVMNKDRSLDEHQSFRRVNYFELLAKQRVHNNPQPQLSSRPIDFTMMAIPDADKVPLTSERMYWLYGDDENEILILTNAQGAIALKPVRHLSEDANGKVRWEDTDWVAGLPLKLFEDSKLRIPAGADRATWLSSYHDEREWADALRDCEYSNAVIGVTEDLQPVAPLVPGPAGADSALKDYERMRRELVQADFHVFAANHWNFNTRFPNPGGNHGSFLRISTHSVWMLAGAGVPAQWVLQPYDSLNFASTVLNLLGYPPPMPDRVVHLAAGGATLPQAPTP
jgi:hypothetical protein